MKKYLLACLACVSTTLMAQHDFDALIKPRITCEDVLYNAYELLPQYYYAGKQDSIAYFLEYWQNKCGLNESAFRVQTLLDIQSGNFHDKVFEPGDYDLLMNFRSYIGWKQLVDSTHNNPLAYYHTAFEDAGQVFRFDSFTEGLAEKIYRERANDLSCDEQAILALYRENPKEYDRIVKACPNGILYQYNQEVEEIIRKTPSANYALITGVWIPQGNVSVLGVHPTIGFQLGMQTGKFLFDLTFIFRFVNAKNTYQVMFDDQLYDTDHFFGGYIGLDVNYQLTTFYNHRVYALSGIAYDGFDALNDEDDDDFRKSIGSLNLNLGMGIKWMINDSFYIGTEWRYNFVNYENRGGTDLSGNTQSIRLVIGGLVRRNHQRGY